MTKRSKRAGKAKRSAAARQPSAVKRSPPGKHRNGVRRTNGRRPANGHRPTLAPSRKTLAATIGSAIAAAALYFTNKSGVHGVTPELTSLVTVAVTFAAAWLIPPGARETIIATDRGHRTAVA